jgi:hypothetical protein
MGYRKFIDRDGHGWELRDRSRSDWEFVPLPGNPNDRKSIKAPGYEKDPFELSNEEVQKLFGSTSTKQARQKKSPFLDS